MKRPGMVLLRLRHAVVDRPADLEIGLVEADAAGQHAHVDAGVVHHADVVVEIAKLRVEQVVRVAALVDLSGQRFGIALEHLGRRVVLLEIDDYDTLFVFPEPLVCSETSPAAPSFAYSRHGLVASPMLNFTRAGGEVT